MIKGFLLAVFLFYSVQPSEHPPSPPQLAIETDLFDMAVACIKKYEGWHTAKNYPYVGYGHRLLPGERFRANISESFADSLLRKDLRQKCSVFRHFGKDSLLLSEISDNRSYPNQNIIPT